MIDDMLLPPGKTCSDCVNWDRCRRFIGSLKPTNTRCDWSPSSFRDRHPALRLQVVGRAFRPLDEWDHWKPERTIA